MTPPLWFYIVTGAVAVLFIVCAVYDVVTYKSTPLPPYKLPENKSVWPPEGETLDAFVKPPAIHRKVSATETAECTVYDAFERVWIESDADLRKRIKTHYASKDQ